MFHCTGLDLVETSAGGGDENLSNPISDVENDIQELAIKGKEYTTLHDYMNEVLERDGAHVDAFYYCPHHPEHGIGLYKKKCHCRKPETGMFEMAERDLPEGIDKVHSYMIGDKRIDAQAGKNFGVTGVLVGTGYGAKEHAEDRAAGLIKEDGSCPAGGYDAYAETLLDAVRGILGGRI